MAWLVFAAILLIFGIYFPAIVGQYEKETYLCAVQVESVKESCVVGERARRDGWETLATTNI